MRTIFIVVTLAAAAVGQEGPVRVNLPPAKIGGEIGAERISDPARQGDWPSITYTKDGSLWALWIEWNDKDADRVLLRRRSADGR